MKIKTPEDQRRTKRLIQYLETWASPEQMKILVAFGELLITPEDQLTPEQKQKRNEMLACLDILMESLKERTDMSPAEIIESRLQNPNHD